jgi:hypothetical protein
MAAGGLFHLTKTEGSPDMKSAIRAVVAAAGMVLAFAYDASAALYLQASSTETQLAKDPKGQSIKMNSTDASLGISQRNGVVDIAASGNYFIMAAIQVGGDGKATGKVRLWLRVNGKDVDNSNCEQAVPSGDFTTVMISQGVNALKKGDKVEAMFSGTSPGIGIVYSKPEGEPAVPSIIFSLFKLD